MSALGIQFSAFLKDPPPEFVFEVATDGVAFAHSSAGDGSACGAGCWRHRTVAGEGEYSDPSAAFAEAVRKLTPPGNARRRRATALILPDNCVRIAVLDFDSFPEKEEERRPLINFRLRKKRSFRDRRSGALLISRRPGKKCWWRSRRLRLWHTMRARTAPPACIRGWSPYRRSRCSTFCRQPALLCWLNHSPGALTVIAQSDGVVTIARMLEMEDAGMDGGATTRSTKSSPLSIRRLPAILKIRAVRCPAKLFIAGFGEDSSSSSMRLAVELDIPVEAIGESGPYPGLAGYLAGTSGPAKSASKKAAA